MMSNWTSFPDISPLTVITGLCTPQQIDPCWAAEEKERKEAAAHDKAVRSYFETLGYQVSHDWNRSHGSWHEIIHPKEGLVCQIDQGVPLAHIVQDFTAMAAGAKQGTSPTDYTICALPEDKLFEELLQKVAQNQMGGIQETLPL